MRKLYLATRNGAREPRQRSGHEQPSHRVARPVPDDERTGDAHRPADEQICPPPSVTRHHLRDEADDGESDEQAQPHRLTERRRHPAHPAILAEPTIGVGASSRCK